MESYKDADWLREEYVVKHRSAPEIAEQFGVTLKVIRYHLKKFAIRRNLPRFIALSCDECGHKYERERNDYDKKVRAGRKHFFCSKDCWRAWLSREGVGEKNGNFGRRYKIDPSRRKYVPPEVRSERGKRAIETRKANGSHERIMECLQEGHKRFFSTQEGKQRRREIGVCAALANGGKETSIERAIRERLEQLGIDFIAQYPFKYYVADFLIPDSNLVIEVQGDYWHGNPNKFTVLNDIQKRRQHMDRSKKTYLERRGYHVLYLWETDIKADLDGCIQRILDTTQSRAGASDVGSFVMS